MTNPSRKSSAEMVGLNWTFSGTDNNGTFNIEPDRITAAACMETAKALVGVKAVLSAILSRLDQLGADGIHTLIQEHARTAARTRAKRHQRAKQARAKLREAKKRA